MQATAATTATRAATAGATATTTPTATTPPSTTPAMPTAATEADRSLAADLYALIAHLHKNCNADLLEAVGTLELSLTQLKLLHHLDDTAAELTLKQAAEAVRVSLPAASRLVEDLFHRGLVERHEDPEDRRMKRISLTDRGRQAIARLNAARLSGLESFVGTLSGPERQGLNDVLDLLLSRAEIAASRPHLEAQE